MKKIAGPNYPYLLQLMQILFAPFTTVDRWSQKYGDTIKIGGDTVCFSSPEAIQAILTASAEQIGYVQQSDIVESLLGDKSLIFLSEYEHQRQKKLILPAFHQASLNIYGEKIIEVVKNTMDSLTIRDSFDVRSIMKKISLDALILSIFGNDNLSSNKISHAIDKIFTLFDLTTFKLYLLMSKIMPSLLDLKVGIWKDYRNLKQELEALIKTEIANCSQNIEEAEKNFLLLLKLARDENRNQMTEQEIYDAILTLIFAGFETAAAAMSWMLYWVYSFPEVKQQLLAEIKSSNCNPKIISRLPYLNAVCQETLRITPPAIGAFARNVKQSIEIDGYSLKPGTNINISIYLAHKRESVYSEANKFKPERFLERQFSPYEYLPFGGGGCRCIGAAFAQYEMKLVLATILNNYELEIVNSRSSKPKRHGIVTIPSGLKMRMVS